MKRYKNAASPFCIGIPVVIAFLFNSGCSRQNGGPARYHLAGAVMVANKPAVYGLVTFIPDEKHGNTGPGTTATIDNGKYKTEKGLGTIGGPHIIEIMAFLSPPSDDDTAGADAPPVRYRTEVDLPREKGIHDFQIPESAPAKKSSRR